MHFLVLDILDKDEIPKNTTKLTLSTGSFYLTSKNSHLIPESIKELTLEWDMSVSEDIELDHIEILNLINNRLNDNYNLDKCTKVKKLSLDMCNSLQTIKLPPKLVYLSFENCNNLIDLPQLPDSLEVLIIKNCNSLEKIPSTDWPKNLKLLIIKNCNSIFHINIIRISDDIMMKIENCRNHTLW